MWYKGNPFVDPKIAGIYATAIGLGVALSAILLENWSLVPAIEFGHLIGVIVNAIVFLPAIYINRKIMKHERRLPPAYRLLVLLTTTAAVAAIIGFVLFLLGFSGVGLVISSCIILASWPVCLSWYFMLPAESWWQVLWRLFVKRDFKRQPDETFWQDYE